jgi:hypothetical protein
MLTSRERAKTKMPAKNVIPKYLNKNVKQRVKVKGSVAIAGI